jgi:hypothetical protein
VAAHSEQILEGIVEREKSLRVPCGFESAHLPLSFAGQLMGDFDPIVGISLHNVRHVAEYASRRSGVASQFVSNDLQWFGTVPTQEPSKKPFCSALITMRLDQNVNHVTVLIHCAPQILLLAVDSYEDLVQVPVVPQPSLTSL